MSSSKGRIESADSAAHEQKPRAEGYIDNTPVWATVMGVLAAIDGASDLTKPPHLELRDTTTMDQVSDFVARHPDQNIEVVVVGGQNDVAYIQYLLQHTQKHIAIVISKRLSDQTKTRIEEICANHPRVAIKEA